MLKKYLVFDLIIIAMLAALGTASKVLVGVPIRILTSSLGIPGGAIAGGIYMLWLALAVGITRKKGAATVMAVVQALLIFIGNLPGSHGVWSLITYVLPGVACDAVFLFGRKGEFNLLHYILGVALANAAGTMGSNALFFNLPIIPLLTALSSAAFSGAVGGLIAYLIIIKLEKTKLLKKSEAKRDEK
jgi:energy-coupling factor transport system substrate-specific component